MIRFIDKHRDHFGVEAICRVLGAAVRGFITSRGYRAAKRRLPSVRRLRDELLVPEAARLHAENYGVYGRRKMHALMRRQGWEIGRDQTERLMRLAGVRGAKKSKRVFTTRSDKTATLPSDLVNRRFTAPAPRRLWVCDVTYVATWSGFAYVAFVTDVYSRRIVGWNVASTLRSEILPMQALDMAAWHAGGRLDGLIHHADHGSNYTAMVCTGRIVELGAVPLDGNRRRQLRQRDGRGRQQPLQDRADPSARALANGRAGRAGDARVSVVVEQSAPPRRARHAHTHRGRERVLR